MAEATLLFGKRGEGKSKTAVRMIRDYLRQDRKVATNLDLKLDGLFSPLSEIRAIRLPDHPTSSDLLALPLGNENPVQEDKNGLLVLDETATFLNSREWNDKDRKGFIAWLAQSRKYGWDLLFLAQHPRMVDAQIRDSLFELSASAKCLNKMAVPFLSPLWALITGKPLRFPRMHVVTFRYGFAPNAPKAMAWWYQGNDLHAGYDTLQKISPITGQQGTSFYLSAWETKGRHMTKLQLYRAVAISSATIGLLIGGALGHWLPPLLKKPEAQQTINKIESIEVIGTASASGFTHLMLADGREVKAEGAKMTPDGVLWSSEGKWYRGAK